MDFGARAAGAGVAHLPEVVLAIAVDDVDRGIEACFFEELGPNGGGFVVEFRRVSGLRCVDRCEKTLGGNAPNLGEKFPAPGQRFLFEIVAEGPVAEHLKHRVVVRIEADVLEVVVFATGANAFLRVCGAGAFRWANAGPGGDIGFAVTEEDRHELVHAGVGEEQSGRVRQQRRRRDDRVALRGEEIEEALADLRGGHGKGRTQRICAAESRPLRR